MERRTLLRGGLALAGGFLMPMAADRSPRYYLVSNQEFRKHIETGSATHVLVPLRHQVHALKLAGERATLDKLKRGYQRALGEASLLHARSATDAGYADEAQKAARTVVRAGLAGEDLDLEALGWAQMALQNLNLHHAPDVALNCAERAQGGSSTVRAWANCLMADAHSRQGEGMAALKTMDVADRLVERGPNSEWLTFGPRLADNYRGVVSSRAGLMAEGEMLLRDTLQEMDARRSQTLHTMTDLTEAYVLQEDPEAAAFTALDVYHGAVARRSSFKLDRLRDVCRPLERWTDEPKVQELRAALSA